MIEAADEIERLTRERDTEVLLRCAERAAIMRLEKEVERLQAALEKIGNYTIWSTNGTKSYAFSFEALRSIARAALAPDSAGDGK